MHLSEIISSELDGFRTRNNREGLVIVETGTIRGDTLNYETDDGWSTLTFAMDVDVNGGNFTSIDLDTSTSERVLTARKLRNRVHFRQGHSIDVLAGMLAKRPPKIDVLFLDSENEAGLILHEFLVARHMMRSPGLVMVDDVDMSNKGVVKGHRIMLWLDDKGVTPRIVERSSPDYTTGVLVFEV